MLALPAFAVDPVNGDTIVVMSAIYSSAAAAQAPTDNFGNTYVQIGSTIRQSVWNSNTGFALWYAKNIVGGSSFVVTDHANNNNHNAVAWCLSGVDTIAPYNGDWVEAHGGGATNPTTGPTIIVPPTNSMFLAFFFEDDNVAATVPTGWNTTGANGFTAGMATRSTSIYTGVPIRSQSAYFIASAVQSAQWTVIIPHAWIGMLISIQPILAPTISGVSPNSGSTLGGTPVTITGTNFLTGTAVTFGGVAATSVVPALNGLSLTCVAPAHAAGLVDVVVTTSAGSATSVNAYTYVKPPATIHPAKAIHGYEAIIYLESTGDVFTVGTTAVVSGTGVTVNLCQRIDNTHLVLHLTVDPAATVSVRDIVVTIP